MTIKKWSDRVIDGEGSVVTCQQAELMALRAWHDAWESQNPVAIALHTGTRQGVKWLAHVDPNIPLYTKPKDQP